MRDYGIITISFQLFFLKDFSHCAYPYIDLYPRSFDVWFFLLFLTLILVHRKWLPSSLYLFALGVLMLPYLTITGGPFEIQVDDEIYFAGISRFHCNGEVMQEPALARSMHHRTFCRHAIRVFGIVCSVVWNKLKPD